jgi:hypothetical protein
VVRAEQLRFDCRDDGRGESLVVDGRAGAAIVAAGREGGALNASDLTIQLSAVGRRERSIDADVMLEKLQVISCS